MTAVSWLLGVLRDLVLAVILVAAFSLWLSACCRCLVLVVVPSFSLKFRLSVILKVGIFGILTVPAGIYGPNMISLLGLIQVNLDIKLIG